MRRKALLVGARASFHGPWVNLEAGFWELNAMDDVRIDCKFSGEGPWSSNGTSKPLEVLGPARLRAVVRDDYNGDGVYLNIKQVR